MKVLSLAFGAALLGLTGTTSASSSTLGILKANGGTRPRLLANRLRKSLNPHLQLNHHPKTLPDHRLLNHNSQHTFAALTVLDGDIGPQNDFYVSAFSLSSALAMTFDRDAIYAQSRAVGEEFYGEGVQVVAGPTSQPLGRTPWGGRNGEGFGPDPYLNGVATGVSTWAYIDAGVIPGAKHVFA
ncbi:Putative Catalytic activity: Hydrolysis of terminal [Aspergillus calidoustus]|uniref:beta-glucosidase n=1 Tax=Aspergillus calidoustus TaxID=454130 RepID=A0A0U5GRX1_ASPCI|nr:Putative Catalytic activity: Hydrolysis of terminal [Aspergillus calidoustus]